MIYRKGEKVSIIHAINGKFNGTLLEPFDDAEDDFIELVITDGVDMPDMPWMIGDKVSCMKEYSKVKTRDVSRQP